MRRMGLTPLERVAMIATWTRTTIRWLAQHIQAALLVLPILAGTAIDVGADDVSTASSPTMIVVQGAAGLEQYESTFREWADRWIAAGRQAGQQVVVIGHEPEANETDKQRLRSTIDQAAKSPGVEFWLV